MLTDFTGTVPCPGPDVFSPVPCGDVHKRSRTNLWCRRTCIGMRLGVLCSGGKDSLFACWKAMQKEEVICLITVRSGNPWSYMFHTPKHPPRRPAGRSVGPATCQGREQGRKRG